MKKSILIILIVVIAFAIFIFLFVERTGIHDPKEYSDIFKIEAAIKIYYLHMKVYPTIEEGLKALIISPEHVKDNWKGPYLESHLVDRWNRDYAYIVPGIMNKPFTVYSTGNNGIDEKCNGDDIYIK